MLLTNISSKLAILLIALTFQFAIAIDTTSANTDTLQKVVANTTLARHDFPYTSHYSRVKGSNMHYVDTGGNKAPILLLHGQPTWSYLWRNVIPLLEQDHRVIALDLIGFGKSDKPDIEYTVEQHAAYLEEFISNLKLQDLTLVLHDWGSFLGFDYAARHPNRIRAIAFMESILPVNVSEPEGSPNREIMDNFYQILTQLRTPDVGEKMILQNNFFIEQILLQNPVLSEDQKEAYREPFANGANRQPMLQFPREISFNGINPAYVVNGMSNYAKYLQNTNTPMLMMTVSPGALIGPAKIKWAKENIKNLEHKHLGAGVHFVQEDHPEAIAKNIHQWLQQQFKYTQIR